MFLELRLLKNLFRQICQIHLKRSTQEQESLLMLPRYNYVDQPRLPDIQQMTFSNYKNSNTFKGLIGISPDGVITFVSSLYPGDKELTKQCGILDMLEVGDSDKGFDIEYELIFKRCPFIILKR